MKKRTAFIAASAAAAFVLSSAVVPTAPAEAQEAVNWRVSTWGNPRAFTRGMEYVAKYVEEQSGGKFTMRIFYGEQLSNSRESLDGIAVGAFEAAFLCASYHPGKNKPLNVLDLPFLPLSNLDVQREVHEAVYAHDSARQAMAAWNAEVYISNLLPQYEFLGRGNPPKSIDDFKDLRVRVLGGMADALRALGAVPTSVPAPEVYTGIERGTMDAVSFPYTYSHASYRIHEVANWFTSNLSPGSVNCPTVFNIDAYNKLPDAYKQYLADAKDGAYEELKKAYAESDEQNLPMFRERMTEVQFPQAELERFQEIGGRPVWEAWVAENSDIPAQELLDLVLQTAADANKRLN